MAINEKLIVQEAAAGVDADPNIMLDLNAGDVDSYDGDGDVWYDIHDFEFKPTTNVSEHFNTVTYDGQSTDLSVTGVGFQPDLVWIKCRDVVNSHVLADSVRGSDGTRMYSIFSDLSSIQSTSNLIETIDSDGFTVFGDRSATNRNNQEYVAWCFKGGGAASLNEEGDIDSQVSANNDLGFSIAKYIGNGSSTGATIGHGLDTPPEMIIVKDLDDTSDWAVYSSVTGNTKKLLLNSSNAAATSGVWNNTSPTSSVFTVRYSQTNEVNHDFIAYSFTSKRGVSKVGSYIGNGSTNNKIYTGFEPAFVMLKNTSISNTRWIIMDNARDPNNPAYKVLSPNLNAAENTSSSYWLLDWERDGFRLKYGADNEFNRNGDTFIYYAVAKDTNETSLIPDTDLELNLEADSYSGSGDWLDSSGNGNNGTITGATWEEELGNFFEFNGSSDKINITSTATTPIDFTAKNYTIEAWINPDTSGVNQIFTKYGSSDSLRSISVMVHSDNKLRLLQRTSTSNNSYSTSTIPQNTWTHIAVTRSSSDVKFYINGELDNTVASTFTPNSGGTQDIIIGANGSSTPSYFNGKIGQVRAYSTELSLTEIRQNYNFTKPKYPNEFHGSLINMDSSNWNSSGYFDFNGSNEFVDLDTSIGSTFWANNWSASAWVYFNSTSSANQCIFTSHGLAYNYLYTNNNTQLKYSNDNGVTITTSSGTISASQWHHIVVTRSSVDGTVIYVDKVSVGTDSSSINAGTSNASGAKPQIGAYTSTGLYPNQYPLDGRVSKFKLYNKALTQSEVDALYNEGE